MEERLRQLMAARDRAVAEFHNDEFFRLTRIIWEQRHGADGVNCAPVYDGTAPE